MVENNEVMGLNEYGSIASITGLIFSTISLGVVLFVNRKLQKLRQSNLFNNTITIHLNKIDEHQKKLNSLTPDITTNETEIKEILVKLLTIFESIKPNLHDSKASCKARKLIRRINRIKKRKFYNTSDTSKNRILNRIITICRRNVLSMCSSEEIQSLYILVNENYNRIEQVKLNKESSNL